MEEQRQLMAASGSVGGEAARRPEAAEIAKLIAPHTNAKEIPGRTVGLSAAQLPPSSLSSVGAASSRAANLPGARIDSPPKSLTIPPAWHPPILLSEEPIMEPSTDAESEEISTSISSPSNAAKKKKKKVGGGLHALILILFLLLCILLYGSVFLRYLHILSR
jgi:hypothetical protein